MVMEKEGKIRCGNPECQKVIGILKKDIIEIKCRHCGAFNKIDPKTKLVVGFIKKDGDKGVRKPKNPKPRKPRGT